MKGEGEGVTHRVLNVLADVCKMVRESGIDLIINFSNEVEVDTDKKEEKKKWMNTFEKISISPA
jgi:hypothetical protein